MSNFLESKLGELNPAESQTSVLYAAVDAGSTQTRGELFTKEGQMRESILVDSNYEVINRDISHVVPQESNVYSSLEFHLIDATKDKSDKQFEDITVVKGDLLSSITSNRQVTSSSASKIDQLATYINIICNVTLLILEYYTEHGVQDSVAVNLVTSLPPEDTKFKRRMDTFKDRLAGDYIVELPRLHTTIAFSINKDFRILSEPEAGAVYTAVEGVLAEEEDSVVCIMDIGGRST